jgi:hypothetical protein
MAYYQVMLEGKNFPLEMGGREEIFGFVTTRWVKAANAEDAELKAIDLVKNDSSLTGAVRDREGFTPMIYLVELATVGWFTFRRRQPGGGYTFYPQTNA